MAGPYSCHLEHLASITRWEGQSRMSASVQSLNGLKQKPFIMPKLCSLDHHHGPHTGGRLTVGGNVKQTFLQKGTSADGSKMDSAATPAVLTSKVLDPGKPGFQNKVWILKGPTHFALRVRLNK